MASCEPIACKISRLLVVATASGSESVLLVRFVYDSFGLDSIRYSCGNVKIFRAFGEEPRHS